MSTPLPNQNFGKYQILERIAAGGTAEVFKARLEGIGGFQRTFAIKRIRPGLSQNGAYIESLVKEAKTAGLLSHANIVQLLDLGQVNGLYYVAMEFVDGKDLGSVLSRCAAKGITFPVPHAIFITLEMLKGLEYAHNRHILRGAAEVPLGLVHRDLSPSNILLSFQGEVKLTDFGIARANADAIADNPSLARGRYDYMSPEQVEGLALDQRSDIFAAGVVLYEMLCGVHPFRRADNQRTHEAERSGTYEPPTMTNPDVPYGLEVILEQALALNPGERFQDSTAFKGALNQFFHDSGFIFSQSTLATFLKGLFPQLALRRRAGSVHDDETRPLRPSDLLDGPIKDAYESNTQAFLEEDADTHDADTVQGSTLSELHGDTNTRPLEPEDEPTRAMVIPPGARPRRPEPQAPQTLVGPRAALQDMLIDHEEGVEDDWSDVGATEIYRAPVAEEPPEEEEDPEPEKTLVGGSQAQQRALLESPTDAWERQQAAARSPRIEKRPSSDQRPPEPAPVPTTEPDSAELEISADTASEPRGTPQIASLIAEPPLAPVPPPPPPSRPGVNPTLAPAMVDDSPTRPVQIPEELARPEVPPLIVLESPSDPLSAPDSDDEVVSHHSPLPYLQPVPPHLQPPEEAPREQPVDRPTGPPEEELEPDDETIETPATDGEVAPEPPQEPAPPRPAKPARTGPSRLVAFFGAAVALSVTLSAGFVLGVAAMLRKNPEIQDPVVLKSPPRLSFVLPDEARLYVDDREVPTAAVEGPTEVTLSPGVPAVVRIELAEHAPFQQTFTLDHNDLRAITFEPAALDPQ